MTKIKNTKKGMAKKTLSVSLAVAMLATSNVPVWAAEFSDGADVAFTSEVEAPVVEAEEPVVEDTVDVPTVEVASDYAVDTTLELKTSNDSWAGNLSLGLKKDETTEKLEIYKGNTAIDPSYIKIYFNNNLVDGEESTAGKITVSDLSSIKNEITTKYNALGFEGKRAAYKDGGDVRVQVYVAGEDEPVVTFTHTLKPYNIASSTISYSNTENLTYNGSIQYPNATVGSANLSVDSGKVRIVYENGTDGKDAGTYTFRMEGVEAEGYTGITTDSKTVTINKATITKDNLSIAVSGEVTYNGSTQGPSKNNVIITDKKTGYVLPKELFDITTSNKNIGTYDSAVTTADGTKNPLGIIVTMNANNGKTGSEEVTNNFTGSVSSEDETVGKKVISGSYKIHKLDLATLTNKYNITVKPQVKATTYTITASDLVIIDRATGKEVSVSSVLPSDGTIRYNVATLPATATSGTVVIDSLDANNVTGTLALPFNIVGAEITADKVYVPAGTKIDGVVVGQGNKVNLATLNSQSQKFNNALTVEYDGTAKEPLKDLFSNLVQESTLVDGSDVKFVLGTDYDIIYTNNTDSDEVRKGSNATLPSDKVAKVTLRFKGNYTGEFSYNITINQAQATAKVKDLPYQEGVNLYEAVADITIGTDANNNKKNVPATAYTKKATIKASAVGQQAVTVYKLTDKNYVWASHNVSSGVVVNDDTITITATVSGKKLTDESVTAKVVGDYTYIGKSITPTVEVKDGSYTLVAGKDYTVQSKAGQEAGDAVVTVIGKGNYSGQIDLKYTIAKADLKDAVVKSNKTNTTTDKTLETNYSQTYIAGTVQGPDIKVESGKKYIKIGDVVLDEYDPIAKTGDYILTYDENAINVGTYNFTITAAATSKKVQGTFTGTYEITARKMSMQFVSKTNPTYTSGTAATQMKPAVKYTGKEIKLEDLETRYVVVDENNNVLTEGKDYRLEYESNIDAGTATVYAYGLGNYAYKENGKEKPVATGKFVIEGVGNIIASNIKEVSDVEYAGGLEVEPKVTIKIGTKTLVQGVDYTVVTGKTEVGEYTYDTVTVIGKGAYTAGGDTNIGVNSTETTKKWNVTKKDLSNTTIIVNDKDVTVMNGTVVVPSVEYEAVFSEDGKKVTVTARASSKNYTGKIEKDLEVKEVGPAVIDHVEVVGNKATVVLSGDVDGATGYDYVIAAEEDYVNGRVDIVKNQLKTSADFTYVDKGVYYAYCHAWTRDENGKKVFGEWSNIERFVVTTTTPAQPVITSVKRSGSTVTVTYTEAADAAGYDVVLGTAVKNGRPVNYGELVKKNIKAGTVTATFKNVPAGTYYAGLHAWNRTSLDNTKVFSQWSNTMKVTVK